ncbi:MAG: hypothetical protein H6523_13160 [Mycolicibacterium sp.]|nr:hypothetical protein [Mycolicibacterium sp.]
MDGLVVLVVFGGIAAVGWFVTNTLTAPFSGERDRKRSEFHAKMAEFRRALAAGENPPRETRSLIEEVEVEDPSDLQRKIQRMIDSTVKGTYYDGPRNVSIVSETKAIIHFQGEFPPDV